MSEKIVLKNDLAEFYFENDDSINKQEIPKALYHFTSIKNEESIEKNGLKCSDSTGNIYFCDTLDGLNLFINIKHALSGETSFVIFVVYTDHPSFDIKYLRKSNDSPFSGYAYYKDIVCGVEKYGEPYINAI